MAFDKFKWDTAVGIPSVAQWRTHAVELLPGVALIVFNRVLTDHPVQSHFLDHWQKYCARARKGYPLVQLLLALLTLAALGFLSYFYDGVTNPNNPTRPGCRKGVQKQVVQGSILTRATCTPFIFAAFKVFRTIDVVSSK